MGKKMHAHVVEGSVLLHEEHDMLDIFDRPGPCNSSKGSQREVRIDRLHLGEMLQRQGTMRTC